MMIVRVTEQVATVVEITYDVSVPDHEVEGAAENVEDYLEREIDEVSRDTLRSQREITNVEVVSS